MVPFAEELNKGKRMVCLRLSVELLVGTRAENVCIFKTFTSEIIVVSCFTTSP